MRKRRPKGQFKKNCSKCNNLIEESRLGRQRYCKSCHAEHMRNTRPKTSELSSEARKKHYARSYVHVYIKRGKIKRESCRVCGALAEAHHEDYDKPLEIIWLCRKHHLEHHKNELNGSYKSDQ